MMTFEEIVEALRAKESPDAIILIAENPRAQKLVVAWKTVEIRRLAVSDSCQSGRGPWGSIEFDRQQWYRHAGLSPFEGQRDAECLIANSIVYPDGTIHEYVQKFLNSLVAERIARYHSSKTQRKK
ncbi:MAG: hypothetical protein IT350_02540 [Deltaproteobacteria bacterium]|nr:hypothetical protein [Deltaproteobacteria bacterium]